MIQRQGNGSDFVAIIDDVLLYPHKRLLTPAGLDFFNKMFLRAAWAHSKGASPYFAPAEKVGLNRVYAAIVEPAPRLHLRRLTDYLDAPSQSL